MDVQTTFRSLFRHRDKIVFDQFEMWKKEREVEEDYGPVESKILYSFRLNHENRLALSNFREEVLSELDEREQPQQNVSVAT